MQNPNWQTVTIIQRRLTHYRVALFEGLKQRLAKDRCHLRLLHGEGRSEEWAKSDGGQLSWAEQLPTRYLYRERFCWQPFFKFTKNEDLLIITQENSMLANHYALFRRPAKRLAFWGHGGNFQGDSRSMPERFKAWTTRQVDWYFAYTGESVERVLRTNFPPSRVTVLNNSIDVSRLKDDLFEAASQNRAAILKRFNLQEGPIGVFVGSLYKQKRLKFLIEAGELIKLQIPDFQLVIVGAGPEIMIAEEAARERAWVHYLGPLHGVEKACILHLATIFLNPGLVGLGILDAFVAGTPLLTTDCGLHSPEIAYLTPNNGVLAPNSVSEYANACVDLLVNHRRLAILKMGCEQAAQRYTLENMIENFAVGIRAALEVPLN